MVCNLCLSILPRTHFHKLEESPLDKIFWGRVNVEKVTAYLYFEKGSHVQKMMHNIKYRNEKDLATKFGIYFGEELAESNHFSTVDKVVPVPLHAGKLKKRGYNQSEELAKGIGQGLNRMLSVNNLIREAASETQTKKNRYERWQNVSDIFMVKNPDEFAGKHILLIDDVITTGSTIEACIVKLLNCPDTRVSVACLAYAR